MGATAMGPWRFVVWFGAVSLLADFVYEGARSVTGPLLASLDRRRGTDTFLFPLMLMSC